MPRRTNFELLLDAASRLPWWANLLIGVSGYFVFHAFAAVPIQNTNTAPIGFASTLFRGVASVLQYAWPLLFVLAAVFGFVRQRHRRNLLARQESLETIKRLSWKEFEWMVGEAYRRKGYDVTESPPGPDGGVDLTARKDDQVLLIQCKHWKKNKVDVRVVRELIGVMFSHGASGCVIVTTGEFTSSAKKEAAEQAIELIDGLALQYLLADINVIESTEQLDSKDAPPCPSCGQTMIKRRNRKTGEDFWGCTQFPQCRGTRGL